MTSASPSNEAMKPPPIMVGASGIAPEKMEPSKAIDWRRLSGLPAFQMFAVERSKRGGDAMLWMADFLVMEGQRIGPEVLYVEYCQWHRNKGLWPDETPLGHLI